MKERKIICKGRCSGKTTELINMLKDNTKAVMVVHNLQQKKDLCDKHPELKKQIKTYDEACNGGLKCGIFTECYLDDAEFYLPDLGLPISVVAITSNNDVSDEKMKDEELETNKTECIKLLEECKHQLKLILLIEKIDEGIKKLLEDEE